NIPLNRVRYIFITHHHSDHNLEYGPLLYNAWITGLPVNIDSYGPKGLEKMTRDFFEYAKFDIEIRMPDEGRPDPRLMVHPHDFEQPGTILKNDDVMVSTCRVLSTNSRIVCLSVRRFRPVCSDLRRHCLFTRTSEIRQRSRRPGSRNNVSAGSRSV